MTYFKRLLLVVPFMLVCTVAIGLSVPPVPGFAVDVQPRICTDEVIVKIINSNLAVGGVQTLAIVSVNGITMEDIKPRITQREGLQEITVQTKEWGRGMNLDSPTLFAKIRPFVCNSLCKNRLHLGTANSSFVVVGTRNS